MYSDFLNFAIRMAAVPIVILLILTLSGGLTLLTGGG